MRRLLAVNPTGLFGGAEVALVRMLRAAAAAGWDPSVLAPEGALGEQLADAAVPADALPDCKLGDGPRLLAAAALTARWLRAARRIRPRTADADVVVANGVLALAPVVWARPHAPVVWLVHDVVTRRDWRAIARTCSHRVRVAVAPSEAVARSLDGLGVREVVVVPHGTPWPVDPAPPPPAGPPVVGLVGNLTPLKGQDVLLEAIARLAARDVVVELVGATFPKDSAYAAALRARARRPDLRGRVDFLGWITDPGTTMRGWTVAVSASVEPEAFGLAVVEAMSLGLPVVATDHGGSSETVVGAGVLVPAGDAAALADALDRLLRDPALRRELAVAGRERVAERYTLDAEARALTEVLARATRRAPVGVTWVVPDLVEGLGGTSRQTLNIGRALAARGHTVRIVARRRKSHLPSHEVVGGLPVTRVGLPGNGALAEKLGIVSVAWQVVRRPGDIVQVLMYPDFAVAAALAGRARRTVMTWAGLGDASDTIGVTTSSFRGLQRRIRCAALTRAANVVLTRAMARELAGLGLPATVIPVPIDLEEFRPPRAAERSDARALVSASDHELVIVCVGQLRRLKAVDRLVDAFAMLRGEGVRARLVLVGGGSGTSDVCEEELHAQVDAAGLTADVTFTGTVTEVRPYLWAADVFVMPSEREGMPNSLLEAMACGVSCVVPAEPVGTELLGPAGIVTDDNAPATLADALRSLVDDPDARSRLGLAARTAATKWSLNMVVDRYEDLYVRIGAGARGRVGEREHREA
jgi:glycosyltransferase involved in cell wall biosynthesis